MTVIILTVYIDIRPKNIRANGGNHMLKNILFVEDDGRTLSLVEELSDEVYHVALLNLTTHKL